MNKLKAYFNNFFWLFLTYFSSPYLYGRFFFLVRRSQKGEGGRKEEVKKILVIQLTKIGDLICTTPVFREIKEKFSSSYLAVLARSDTKDILKNNPRVNEIISISDYRGVSGRFKLIKKIRQEKYDWVFNFSPIDLFANIIGFWALIPNRAATIFEGSGEIVKALTVFNNLSLKFKMGALLPAHYLDLLKFIGIESVSQKKEIFISQEEEKKAADFLRMHNLNPKDNLIGISCTSGTKFNQWDPDKFADLADQLIEKLNAKIIFIGSLADQIEIQSVQKKMRFNSVSSAGVFTIKELAGFLKNLKLFIGVDTGPVYIADALDIPVVVIAGPDSMVEQKPIGINSRIIKKNIYCAPCLFVFSGIRYCKEGHLRCLKETTVDEVFGACQELMDVVDSSIK